MRIKGWILEYLITIYHTKVVTMIILMLIEYKIIGLYLKICRLYNSVLQFYCERFSNNKSVIFTDEEILTIYIMGIIEGLRTIKDIYRHAQSYWYNLFPAIPSYQAFNNRLNRLENIFPILISLYQEDLPKEIYNQSRYRIIDSMPIVMAKNNRRFNACVAPDIADENGYCSAKRLYYYGVKLHIMASYEIGNMPIPEIVGITHAGMNDGKAYEQICYREEVKIYTKFADKAYMASRETNTYTPIKKEKGQNHLDAADQLYSKAISTIRQPIESLNNWIQQKTGIDIASKVRSTKGLMVHVFGRLCAAFEILTEKYSYGFNP